MKTPTESISFMWKESKVDLISYYKWYYWKENIKYSINILILKIIVYPEKYFTNRISGFSCGNKSGVVHEGFTTKMEFP